MENSVPPVPRLVLSGVSVDMGGHRLLDQISLAIRENEQWAIIGDSGSGKTTLAHVLSGKIFYRGQLQWSFPTENSRIELVTQQHHFKNLSNTSSFYYQQRFNASDAGDSMLVADVLGDKNAANPWIDRLHLTTLWEKPLLQLSNGENKRLQLAKALLADPAVLILDNPFLGLDTEGRATLHRVLHSITANRIQIIIITSPSELPACITHVALLEKGQLVAAKEKKDYLYIARSAHAGLPATHHLLQQLARPAEDDFAVAIKMKSVTIRYGEKTVLDNINWEVKKGECWNIAGPNGAGKSTLLSLITADNPQAYANDIILFDRPRGTGESIWDIKRRTGFVSPELHLYFEQHASCYEVIASGLFDTIGLFKRLTQEQHDTVLLWMQLLQLVDFRDMKLFQLSASQQRMALLARALVKNPPLLILDEPTQGLDEQQTDYFKALIDEICPFFGSTLLYVSHYSRDLPSCINHFLRLDQGRQTH